MPNKRLDISLLTILYDKRNRENKVISLNTKNKGFTSMNKIDLVDNNNISVSDLSREKLQLKGNSISVLDNNHICICMTL